MRCFDVLVCPSVSEGFGLTVLEGLASGVPVVVSRSVGALEIVQGERGVLVAESGDAASFSAKIVEALGIVHDHSIPLVSETTLSEFTWQAYARRFEQICSSLG